MTGQKWFGLGWSWVNANRKYPTANIPLNTYHCRCCNDRKDNAVFALCWAQLKKELQLHSLFLLFLYLDPSSFCPLSRLNQSQANKRTPNIKNSEINTILISEFCQYLASILFHSHRMLKMDRIKAIFYLPCPAVFT